LRHAAHYPGHYGNAFVIVLDLSCDKDHRFEGWFGSADAFEDQLVRGLLDCPVCGSKSVRRLPSAPYVQTRRAAAPLAAPPPLSPTPLAPEPPAQAERSSGSAPVPAEAAAAVLAMLRKVAREADDVGARLPEEARRMHYGEAAPRTIRGAASRGEVVELLEEGIMLMPVPPAEEDLH
jgi:hypothetical protein